ncbi:transposase [Ochrobactrum chromiisoli]|uniref:Transposase n=1 Tax=Ochrobactrum chromiisoli TaxID=2993941 RepID=A0ABT3QKS8_9HYPH|nr:transposase [Ochrobactrum chromiisoli]MCX2696218.1 transposase [Ochrobactrum chromiisoli]
MPYSAGQPAVFRGMMWIARTGSQWRHLPDEYGKWDSVFWRYRRWVSTGVFEVMLETLAEMVEQDVTPTRSIAPWSEHIIVQSA